MSENLLSKTAHLEHTHTEKREYTCQEKQREARRTSKVSQGVSWRWSEDTQKGFMTLARV